MAALGALQPGLVAVNSHDARGRQTQPGGHGRWGRDQPPRDSIHDTSEHLQKLDNPFARKLGPMSPKSLKRADTAFWKNYQELNFKRLEEEDMLQVRKAIRSLEDREALAAQNAADEKSLGPGGVGCCEGLSGCVFWGLVGV